MLCYRIVEYLLKSFLIFLTKLKNYNKMYPYRKINKKICLKNCVFRLSIFYNFKVLDKSIYIYKQKVKLPSKLLFFLNKEY